MHLAKCEKKLYFFVVVIYLAIFHILLLWYTLSLLFTALTHSVCIVLTLHALTHSVFIALTLICTDSNSVSCFQDSLPSLSQCLLPQFFTALSHLLYTVVTFHCTYSVFLFSHFTTLFPLVCIASLSVRCPHFSLHCLT
jgi:hypothetical protein